MAKPLTIDSNNYAPYFTEAGYEVEYLIIDGGQGGLTLSGEMEEDEIAQKAEITLPCWPLNEEQLADLLSVIYNATYHTVTYYDPKAGGTRTITARRKVSRHKYRGFGANGLEYWTGVVVTLTEK